MLFDMTADGLPTEHSPDTRHAHDTPGSRRFPTTVHRALRRLTAAGALVATATMVTTALSVTASAHHTGDQTATEQIDGDDRSAAPIACPLVGPSEFIDSWGAPRSGGRRHQGVDMIADRGTPIVAAEAGDANFKQSRLGGNSVWLTTPTGDRYFYAHLDGFEGESRTVGRGEVIGYVGSTGNAGGPHLHFERHLGGAAVNPFGAVYSACVPTDAVSFAHDAPGGLSGPGGNSLRTPAPLR